MVNRTKQLLLFLAVILTLPLAAWAGEAGSGHPAKDGKGPAILLVTFGTSFPSAQASFVNIEQQVKKAFPNTEIRWAYTSKIIRKKLAKQGQLIDSPEVAMARLMDEGYAKVVMQSLKRRKAGISAGIADCVAWLARRSINDSKIVRTLTFSFSSEQAFKKISKVFKWKSSGKTWMMQSMR